MKATTTTGNTVELNGFFATVKGLTFEVRKTDTGIRSAYAVKEAGSRIIELAFAAELAAVHTHMDAEAAKLAEECKVKFAAEYMAEKIHNGHGDAVAAR